MAVYVLAIECPRCNAQPYHACNPEAERIIASGWVCEERIEAVTKLNGVMPSPTYRNGTPILSEDV